MVIEYSITTFLIAFFRKSKINSFWYYLIEEVFYIKKIICFLSLLLMLCSCTNKEEIIIQQEHVSVEQEEIIIEIKGAVKIPGLYTSYKGVLLFEIINQAGGTLNNADMSRINLVQIYNNNASIEIPFTTSNTTQKNIVNINTATINELMTLKGIGKTKAEKIIVYRNTHSFTSIEEIMNVSGIGEDIFTGIKDNITV